MSGNKAAIFGKQFAAIDATDDNPVGNNGSGAVSKRLTEVSLFGTPALCSRFDVDSD